MVENKESNTINPIDGDLVRKIVADETVGIFRTQLDYSNAASYATRSKKSLLTQQKEMVKKHYGEDHEWYKQLQKWEENGQTKAFRDAASKHLLNRVRRDQIPPTTLAIPSADGDKENVLPAAMTCLPPQSYQNVYHGTNITNYYIQNQNISQSQNNSATLPVGNNNDPRFEAASKNDVEKLREEVNQLKEAVISGFHQSLKHIDGLADKLEEANKTFSFDCNNIVTKAKTTASAVKSVEIDTVAGQVSHLSVDDGSTITTATAPAAPPESSEPPLWSFGAENSQERYYEPEGGDNDDAGSEDGNTTTTAMATELGAADGNCHGTAADGQKCKRPSMIGKQMCWSHRSQEGDSA
ncbi:hypothetical protein ACHAXM_010285 [Skeletonema potamos]